MQVINWPELQPLPADLEALSEHLHEALPLGSVCQLLVEATLRTYPWAGRADLISCYHASQTYKQGQKIALFIPDSQNVRRIVWLLAQVRGARFVENSIQGRFQVLTLDINGRQIQMAGGIANASYPEPDLSNSTPEDFAWLVRWVLETYAAALQATVRKLIQRGQIHGKLVGETFLPEQVSALSPELLHPCFAHLSLARPWISLEEILKGLPDLSQLEREPVLTLLRAALKGSHYRSLGGDRWTTPELFSQLNRDVLRDSPTAHLRSKGLTGTKRNEQDLAGYDNKFMPPEARRALEELGFGEKGSEPESSPWRPPPPDDALRLPALSYLHITQAYLPVRAVMRAFAPDVQLVFLQLITGDHQPFLLDREKGLLKAIHPAEFQAKILNEDLPAGTYLWLEHQGSERYRIAPRPLPFKRMVPCKLASLEHGQLHIEHTHISMRYAGDASLFKAKMRFEEIEALFAEARRVNLRVREALIYVLQELCATDPDHRAYWLDLLNAVFLKRMCSPHSVLSLLYTEPCFEPVGGGYFRYKLMPHAMKNTRKPTSRLSQLWDGLRSDPVAPHPVAEERTTVGAHLEVSYLVSAPLVTELERQTHLSLPDAEPEVSVAAHSFAAVEENATRDIALEEEERPESLLLSKYEEDPFTPPQTEASERKSDHWRDSLERLLHSLGEFRDAEPFAPVAEETNSEPQVVSDMSIEMAHEESLSFSSPFRWDPKPAWIQTPVQSKPPFPNMADPRRFVSRPKIPIRPLHKQPFYKRFFFYLRRWLTRRTTT